MNIEKISVARRRKVITRDQPSSRPFCRWNSGKNLYEFGFTFSGYPYTGESYEIVGNQLEWEQWIEDLRPYFREATG